MLQGMDVPVGTSGTSRHVPTESMFGLRRRKEGVMTVEERINGLERRIEELTGRVGILEDAHAIRNLQHKYGYYMDKAFYEAIVDLFSEDCEIHFLAGIFRGRAGARRLFIDRFRATFAGGVDGPKPGVLMEHPQLQDIIDVAPDRKTAKARFRYFMQAGTHYTTGKAHQWWEGGLYENVYVTGERCMEDPGVDSENGLRGRIRARVGLHEATVRAIHEDNIPGGSPRTRRTVPGGACSMAGDGRPRPSITLIR